MPGPAARLGVPTTLMPPPRATPESKPQGYSPLAFVGGDTMFVDADTAKNPNNQTNTSITVSLPCTFVGGVNYLHLSVHNAGTGVDSAINTPSGWTVVGYALDDAASATPVTTAVYAKAWDPTDGTSITVTWGVAGQGAILATGYVNVGTALFADATVAANSLTGTSKSTGTASTSLVGIIASGFTDRSGGAGYTITAGAAQYVGSINNSSGASIYGQTTMQMQPAGSYTVTATGPSTAIGGNWIYRIPSLAEVSISATATPSEGAGTGAANDATALVTTVETGLEATATGTANNPTIVTDDIFTGGSSGNSTGPSITFPSTIRSGQNIYIVLMQNNTDVITATPAVLQTLDAITPTGGGASAANLYRFVADGTTASSTISWTLSATRNWSISWIAVAGAAQDDLDPYNVFSSSSDTVTATSTFTADSVTSTAAGYVLEFFAAKANGTALADMAVGGSMRRLAQQFASTGTFGSNTAVAILPGYPSAAGSYGGETWTTDQSVATTFRYTIVLDQQPGTAAAVAGGTAYDATVTVAPVPTEAAATGTAAWDAGDTVDSIATGDNPIAATGTAYDATVLIGTITPATEATATGVANDAAPLVTPPATEATSTGAANDATASIAPIPAEAAATGSALDAAPQIAAVGGNATATGAANDAVPVVTALPAEAAATGSALDPTVVTGSNTFAPATEATATGTANDASAAVTPAATEATATGVANDASTSVVAIPAEAAGTGTAYDAVTASTANGTALASEAAATGAAFDAIIAVSFTATEATALAAAADALGRVTATSGLAAGTGSASNVINAANTTVGTLAAGTAATATLSGVTPPRSDLAGAAAAASTLAGTTSTTPTVTPATSGTSTITPA